MFCSLKGKAYSSEIQKKNYLTIKKILVILSQKLQLPSKQVAKNVISRDFSNL